MFRQILEILPCVNPQPCRQFPSRVSSINSSLSGLCKIVFCPNDEYICFIRDVSEFGDPVSNVLKALQIGDIVQDEGDMCTLSQEELDQERSPLVDWLLTSIVKFRE